MFPLAKSNDVIELEGFHNIYYFEFGKDHRHPPEEHSFWEMVYVDKGKILANTNGNICTLEEGQAIFHSPGQVHAHISDTKVANNMLVVSFSCKSKCMDFFSGKIFTLGKTEKMLLSLFTTEAKSSLGEIPGDFHNIKPLSFDDGNFGSSQLMKNHFTELLIKLYREYSSICDSAQDYENARFSESNEFLDKIIQYLKDNIYGDVTLDDICTHFFIRKSRLSVIFKQYTGKSPIHYFKYLKIEKAKQLLREESLSVSQICDILGYSGIHNFTRSFKTSTGFSPTGYRKSILMLQG